MVLVPLFDLKFLTEFVAGGVELNRGTRHDREVASDVEMLLSAALPVTAG
jgi:hypothetical protein